MFDPNILSLYMASLKLILRKKANKEGKFPICIQIIKNRKASLIHIGQYIDANDWDETKQKVKKTNSNHAELNKYLLRKLTEANGKYLELATEKEVVSAKSIKQRLTNNDNTTFKSQAEIYLDNLKKGGKYNRYSADKPRITRFYEFTKGGDITFQEITIPLLNKFKAYLKSTRGISDRTIVNHLVVIRSIFSQVISGNLVDAKYYPFGKDKIKIKFPDSIKIGLEAEEVKKLENVDLKEFPIMDHARNLWLLSFYFAGMRVSDLLRLKRTDINNGRLQYSMGKNNKVASFKIPDKALEILNPYLDLDKHPSGYVFKYLHCIKRPSDNFEIQRKINQAVKVIDENLSKLANMVMIDKVLTTHIARHTFGNLSGDRIPIQMLQKLYRHTSITTTIGYQANFINKDTDEAVNSVINF